MKINIICVGTRMPAWVEAGVADYRKRLPRDFEVNITEVPMGARNKSQNLAKSIEKEGDGCMRAVADSDYLIVLDVKGKQHSTESLAQEVSKLRDEGFNLALIIGGPDGLAPQCLQAAKASWSLSSLTYPHPVVRIVIIEQLYRVWSLLAGHPYHRA